MKKRLFAFAALFLSLAVIPAASAKVPLCKGKNILPQERAKNPALFDKVMRNAEKIPNGRAIFWRIEKPGTQKVSWLFGTIHITDPRVHNLPQQARKAINGAKTVALELKDIGDPQAAAKKLFQHLTLIVLKPGENVWDMLGKEKAAIVKRELARRGLPSGMFAGMQPYVIAMMMAQPQCEMIRAKAGLKALDSELANIAEKNKAQLVGLETMKEQFVALSSMPMAAQQAFLVQTAKNGTQSADVFETMVQLYLQRKMHIMYGLIRLQEGKGVANHFTQVLLDKRNRTMVKRAIPLIDEGNAFIAVGALHLVGKNGLVSLLENAGYKLVPVN